MQLALAQNIAEEIITDCGLVGWSFHFDYARKRFGKCDFGKKEITLSRVLTELNPKETVRETILHEVAHALAGPRQGHGKGWQEKMRFLGVKPARCYGSEVRTPLGKYTARCVCCNTEFQTQRANKRAACKACCKKYNGGRYSVEYQIVYTEN